MVSAASSCRPRLPATFRKNVRPCGTSQAFDFSSKGIHCVVVRQTASHRFIAAPSAFLRSRRKDGVVNKRGCKWKLSSRCIGTRVYDGGDQLGVMGQLEFEGGRDQPAIVVASTMQVSVDRKSPVARDIAAYQKLRHERFAGSRRPRASTASSPPVARGTAAPPYVEAAQGR
jgi:hypothetical protein